MRSLNSTARAALKMFFKGLRGVVLCSFFVMPLAFVSVHAETSVPLPPEKPLISAVIKPVEKLDLITQLLTKVSAELPQNVISRQDADLYKLIFEAQETGDFAAADQALEKVQDLRLLGHVLYQRYMHPTAYHSRFEELQAWLKLYADHPGARDVYRLAVARMPKGTKQSLTQPEKTNGIVRVPEPTMHNGRHYVSGRKRSSAELKEIGDAKNRISKLLNKGQASSALNILSGVGARLDPVEYDVLRGEIAAVFLYEGHPETALKLAQESVDRSGLHVPKAGWVAGLVSWRAKNYGLAVKYFEVVARSPYASSWTAASGAYWAARSHMRQGNVKAVSTWLQRGMTQPRTFYGLISTRALGRDFDFNWKVPNFTKEYMDVLNAIPAANRAMALVMVDQLQLAELELARIKPAGKEQQDALLAYTGYANLPGFAMRLASVSSGEEEGVYYDAALYPMGPWRPQEGYTIDPALVHAIMRQESRFDPSAQSPSGAKGLMQIMPNTARGIGAGEDDAVLDHPETNLELGQRYLEDLLQKDSVRGDLFNLLIAYNAGPGNLAKWQKRWPDVEDPLLFIELIPSSETRAYVERVLSNYWIYRLREGQPTPSLDAIAAGKSAHYAEAL